MHLADIQEGMRDAVVTGDVDPITPFLIGGDNSGNRLAIHRRNYESSLVNALISKFPGTVWLVGTSFLTDMARRFVHENPPQAPCIAEYGESFPRFLVERSAANHRLPYLRAFAELEWHVGHAAIATDQPAVTLEEFWKIDASVLSDMTLKFQHGVRYMNASWPIDDLLKLYLAETAPAQYPIATADVWLEIHGSRGKFQIDRLDAAEFIFRAAIASGRTIGDAAEMALDAYPAFHSGDALVSLILSGTVTGDKLQ